MSGRSGLCKYTLSFCHYRTQRTLNCARFCYEAVRREPVEYLKSAKWHDFSGFFKWTVDKGHESRRKQGQSLTTLRTYFRNLIMVRERAGGCAMSEDERNAVRIVRPYNQRGV